MSKIGIILVDDNDLDLLIGERLISKVNPDIIVNSFTSGEGLFRWLTSGEAIGFADHMLFLVDIYMPDCDGFEVAEKIISFLEPFGCKPAVYLLSATLDRENVAKINSHPDISGFIGKPLTPKVLLEILKKSNIPYKDFSPL